MYLVFDADTSVVFITYLLTYSRPLNGRPGLPMAVWS